MGPLVAYPPLHWPCTGTVRSPHNRATKGQCLGLGPPFQFYTSVHFDPIMVVKMFNITPANIVRLYPKGQSLKSFKQRCHKIR